MSVLFFIKTSSELNAYKSIAIPRSVIMVFLDISKSVQDPDSFTDEYLLISARAAINQILEKESLSMEENEIFWTLLLKIDRDNILSAYSNW